jgi:hypothetical protein
MSTQSNFQSGAIEASKQPPWWRLPIVWMVIAGPALVVVASLVTAAIAVTHVDPVLDTSKDQVHTGSNAPALLGRNHAAEAAKQPADR